MGWNVIPSIAEPFDFARPLAERDAARLQLVEFMLTSAREAAVIYDVPMHGADSRIVFVNAAFEALVGENAIDLVGRPAALAALDALAESREPKRRTHRRSSGDEIPLEVVPVPLADEHGAITHVVAFCRTARIEAVSLTLLAQVKAMRRRNATLKREIRVCKRIATKLLRATCHDSLTGLPNRALFLEHVHLALVRSKKLGKPVSVLFLDCDRFKLVNDTFGQRVGDLLLAEVARRVQMCLRPVDVLARLGGDEFTILLEEGHERAIATNVAQRISKTFDAPFHLEGEAVYLTASIGIALSKPGDECAEDLVRDADIAMDRAKELGKHRYEVFSNDFRDRRVRRRLLDTELRRALDCSSLAVAYQPIVSLADGKLEGFEALIRWHHAELGTISPEELISVAEESGLIVEVGEWILSEACATAAGWRRQFPGLEPLSISVNVSAKQLLDERFTRRVCNALMQSGLRAEQLRLEITESSLMTNLDIASSLLSELRSLGIQSHIDDFGTGYSSLTYLQQLPIGVLKIDRSFVSSTSAELANPTIVRAIINLAQNLGLRVVAEGVESIEQARDLHSLRCTFAQGYLYAKPLAAADVAGYIETYEGQYGDVNARIRGGEIAAEAARTS